VKIIVAATEFCCCDLSRKFKWFEFVGRIAATKKRKQPYRTMCTHLRQVAATKFQSTNEEASIRFSPY